MCTGHVDQVLSITADASFNRRSRRPASNPPRMHLRQARVATMLTGDLENLTGPHLKVLARRRALNGLRNHDSARAQGGRPANPALKANDYGRAGRILLRTPLCTEAGARGSVREDIDGETLDALIGSPRPRDVAVPQPASFRRYTRKRSDRLELSAHFAVLNWDRLSREPSWTPTSDKVNLGASRGYCESNLTACPEEEARRVANRASRAFTALDAARFEGRRRAQIKNTAFSVSVPGFISPVGPAACRGGIE